jgi:hypothetical protein
MYFHAIKLNNVLLHKQRVGILYRNRSCNTIDYIDVSSISLFFSFSCVGILYDFISDNKWPFFDVSISITKYSNNYNMIKI